jgi:phosphoglycerate dehydrogenase-like enzyme
MTVICVPTQEMRAYLKPLSDDSEILAWDPSDAPPEGLERVEFLVPSYTAPSYLLGSHGAELLAGIPALRVLQVLSAGVEVWIDVVPPGVVLCNGRGIHGGSTAELGFAGLLAVLHHLPAQVEHQREQAWEGHLAESLWGKRVLIVGAGDIGQHFGAAARVFGAETTLIGRRPRAGVHPLAELPTLLPKHDVVLISLPMTPETAGLVDADFLAAMPDDAVLVNVARGGLVDTDALIAELSSRRLRAFLDVTDPEPLPVGHPLWRVPNLLLTPHVGGGSVGWERRANQLVADQIMRLRAGQPLGNVVEAGY